MARTELPNGVILPAEYSDDWYEDMTSNLTKLDDVIGSDSEKLNADGVYFLRMSSAALTDSGTGNFSDLNSSYKIKTGDLVLDSGRKLYQIVSVDSANSTFSVGNSLFKVTAESDLAPVAESGDYDDLDNKPDLNPYDQHLANTDIHVTSADKQKWNDNVSQSYVLRYASTAVTPSSTIAYSVLNNTDNVKAGDSIIDSAGKVFLIVSVDNVNETVTVGAVLLTLALDANVMHLSGNETADGYKTFSKYITSDGSVAGDEYTSNAKTNLWLMGNRDVENVSGILFDTFRQNTAQGTGIHILGISIKENSVRYEGCRFGWYWDNNLNGYILDFKPTTQGANQAVKHNLGTSIDKWDTINGINPGSLSMPDLSNGVDISGYITVTDNANVQSTYTPPANGWVCVKLSRTSGAFAVLLQQENICGYGRNIDLIDGTTIACGSIPVINGVQVSINSALAGGVVSAYFYPCQGNV